MNSITISCAMSVVGTWSSSCMTLYVVVLLGFSITMWSRFLGLAQSDHQQLLMPSLLWGSDYITSLLRDATKLLYKNCHHTKQLCHQAITTEMPPSDDITKTLITIWSPGSARALAEGRTKQGICFLLSMSCPSSLLLSKVWITMDNNEQQWITMDNNEQQLTTMDNNG